MNYLYTCKADEKVYDFTLDSIGIVVQKHVLSLPV